MSTTQKKSRKVGLAVTTLAIGLAVVGATGCTMNNDQDSNHNDQAAMAEDGVTVGGAKMVASKDIVDNAVNASNVSTTVDLVKKADLVTTLKGTGPFTVFAPNNDAFGKLPPETVSALQQPANVAQLKNILTYHVVAGTYTSADLRAMAAKGETLKTVQGEMLTPVIVNKDVELKDAKGNTVMIETADVISSNGVTHVISSVLMP
jgi:uncharacterized surface protein with fasciclin (FAS1) repeats